MSVWNSRYFNFNFWNFTYFKICISCFSEGCTNQYSCSIRKKCENYLFGKTTLSNEYEERLKKLNIFSKMTSLQGYWIKKLYDGSFHTWKVIPSFLKKKFSMKNFLFHSDLSIKHKLVKKFYQEILTKYEKLYLLL